MLEFISNIVGIDLTTASAADYTFLRFVSVPLICAVISVYKTIIACIFNIFIRKG